MPYGEVISRSFAIWWRHKYLWLLGMLAGGFGASGGSGFRTGGSAGRPGGRSATNTQVADWISSHAGLVILGAAAIVLVLLVLFVVSCIAAPALIEAAAWHDGDEPFSFRRAWRVGRVFFWRFLGFRLLFLLFVMLAGTVFSIFILLTVLAFSAHAVVIGVLLVLSDVVLGLLLLAGFVAAAIAGQLAAVALVLERLRVRTAIRRGISRFRERPGRVLLVWLIQVGFSFAASFAVVIVLLPLVAIGIGLGFAAYSLGSAAFVTYLVIALLAGIAAIWALIGVINSYFTIYWVVAYRRLDRQPPPVNWPYAYPAPR